MKQTHWIATLALIVATVTSWAAETPAPAPATADPLAGYIKPAEWLRKQPKPKFKEGHTLPPLTRYGWSLSNDANIEFAEHWGYCLQLGGGYFSMAVADRLLNDPKDPDGQLITLAATDPKKYKLAVITSREMPAKDKAPAEMWCRDAEGKLLNAQLKSQDGNAWTPGVEAVLSPAGPDSFWEESGRLQAAPLKRLNERFPIAIILNGGEYGLPCAGQGRKIWENDPAIVKAKGDKKWARYAGERMGRSQQLIADNIREAVPNAEYIFYLAGGAVNRNQYGWWDDWNPHYEDSRGIGTLPTSQMYFRDFNDGWLGNSDALTFTLNGRGQEIKGGQPFHYQWLCAGYKEYKPGDWVSDIPRYMGYLRCIYTAGVIAGNAGYYTFPRYPSPPYPHNTGGFDVKFPPNEPPHWLEQMVALARVHAQFSHLEDYLRQGDLLPGPYAHTWSFDQQPAYELVPRGFEPDPAKVRSVAWFPPDDPAMSGWEQAGFDDSTWKTGKVPQPWRGIPEFPKDLSCALAVGHRKTITVPAEWAGKDLVLNLCLCDGSDITYWNGKKIGGTDGVYAPRTYKIPGAEVKAGPATIALRVSRVLDGNGGTHGKPEAFTLALADGSNPIPLAGEWKWQILSRATHYLPLAPGRPVRVLARKLKDKPQWLITAWAADGQEREVSVPVPDLGEVKLKATAEANVYEATLKDGKPVVKLAAGG
jgi:hypothetical protein